MDDIAGIRSIVFETNGSETKFKNIVGVCSDDSSPQRYFIGGGFRCDANGKMSNINSKPSYLER